MRTWLIAALALIVSGGAFHFAADSAPEPLHKRFSPGWIAVGEDWTSPAPRHGRARVVENRVARPRMKVPFLSSDTYRLRIFYILDGEKPASVRLSGKKVGRLAPAREWSRTVVSTSFVLKDKKEDLSFELPAGSRLSIRRIDYRNYFFRIGSFFLAKPEGGSRAPYNVLWLIFTMVGMTALGILAMAVSRGRADRPDLIVRMGLPAGLAGLLINLLPKLFDFSIHAHPAFLTALFIGITAAAALPRARRGWKIALGRLAAAAVSTAVAVAIAEGALRLWDPPISRPRIGSYVMYSPELGWKNRPGAQGWQVDIGYHIRINKHGHRGPDYPEKKSPGVFRVLGLGDSFTFGWGVEDGQTFLRVLERRLREAGRRVEVLNAAVPAWHSIQSLRYLRKEGVRFRPDLIVMSYFVDDVYDSKIESFRNSEKAKNLRNEETELRRRKNSLSRKLRLYNVWFNYRKIRRATKEHLRRNPYLDFESERKALPRNFEKNPKLLEGLERVVSGWVKAREELGIPMIFSYIPAGGSLNAPAYQGQSHALKRVSRAKGFPFLDVVSLFEKYPDPRRLYLHPRDGHMSAAGHAVVGEALSELVLKGGWLRK
ncbi:MAG: SGNH/GDSL hydrolase family protein [bacterium]